MQNNNMTPCEGTSEVITTWGVALIIKEILTNKYIEQCQ